ncbi:hypothetical protein [Francisella philomiragia]|uniref:hypothetical protein n=1 Tax=Francisella philomiragia TaxID=28110 RepID=UPI001906B657|nr:hypothetical protein [Francisella philomiragia]MBK2093821.1 hypothetical protein [Francisella philomiragia]MBK2256291.1 hypothetical protein [Francisella philomiragia]MBK2268949.1 hypothetical protein [Francisella philomiragia]MBK2270577.1 hypothetical protein [Francisella philomiragia]MBK2274356.1 hypothetical protein [Francisella philomiragia]
MLGIVDAFIGIFAFLIAYENKWLSLLSTYMYQKYNLLIFIILTICLILLAIFKYILEPTIFKYRKTNKSLCFAVSHYRNFLGNKLRNELIKHYKNCNFNKGERITVFLYAEGMFFPLARYSKNPKYDKFGRNFIQKKNEYLFSVINDDKEKVDDFRYNKIKFWRRVMKSKDMYCYEILSEAENIPIGIISFQSTENGYFTKNKKSKIKKESEEIASFVNSLSIDMKMGSSNAKPPEGM